MATSHLHFIMTAQEYIQQRLEKLKEPLNLNIPGESELVETIFRLVMSKKFRKYSANSDLQEHIREAIRINIGRKEPINVTFLFGAYKLWRLEESPEADWAELFAFMYYASWLKPVCEVYKPGVQIDCFVDDLIIPKLNNTALEDTKAYIKSLQQVFDFLKNYAPANMQMTITPVGSKFTSTEEFDASVEKNHESLSKTLPESGHLELDEKQLAMVSLNARPTDEQLADPHWREKIFLIHNAYLKTKAEPKYHFRPEKILAFTNPLPSGTVIAVGTTKDSIMKFWIGAGLLKPRGDSFRQVILSSNQLKQSTFDLKDIAIKGLVGKNFKHIRVLK